MTIDLKNKGNLDYDSNRDKISQDIKERLKDLVLDIAIKYNLSPSSIIKECYNHLYFMKRGLK